jgi:hypothetical protein
MAAKDYVYGVKGPARVANQYKWTTLKMKIKKIIKEELQKALKEQALAPGSWGASQAEKERQARTDTEAPSWMKDLPAVQKGIDDKETKAKARAAGKPKRKRSPKRSATMMMQAKVNLAIAGAKKDGKEVPDPIAIDGRTGPLTRGAIKALRALEPNRMPISQIISKYAKAVIGDADITKAAAKLAVDADLKTNPSIAAIDSALKGMLGSGSAIASGAGPDKLVKEGFKRFLKP